MVSNLDSLTTALEQTHVSPNGVTFAGKSLKLDNENDAKEVIEEIDKCTDLQYLNLEGNTLGVDASKHIAKALEKHPEFKRALWKDMFTGRLKEEIPKALSFLGNGLVVAGARLVELDLSDNAFGPIGVQGLAALLKSSSCYALEELRLNNNGLGITGGKLLASALTECYNCSKKQGKALALKVFIAGRNRLENEGAKALAQVFKMIGTLEEIAMPQNGIYHVGIQALSEAFTYNKNLKILNLNDNTIGAKGAKAIADVLPQLQKLEKINFGDCLLKTNGALLLAGALKNSHKNLEEIILGFNEIKYTGGLQVVAAMENKSKLKSLVLDGNQFGESGLQQVKQELKKIGKVNVLGSMEENESEGSGDEEDDDESSDNDDEDDEEEDDDIEDEGEVEVINDAKEVTVKEFLSAPSEFNFIALGQDRIEIILKECNIKNRTIEEYIRIIMKISTMCNSSNDVASHCSQLIMKNLYKDLFLHAEQSGDLPLINNSLLVNLGLIKSEDKQFKPTWNLEGCFYGLCQMLKGGDVPQSTKDVLKVFLSRDVENCKEFERIKRQMLTILG